MRYLQWMFPALLLVGPCVFGAAGIAPAHVTVGESLEIIANITLDEAAPSGGLEVTLTSSDASRLRFSKTPEGRDRRS